MNGVIIGQEESILEEIAMKLLPVFFHKSEGCITFIIFGVSLKCTSGSHDGRNMSDHLFIKKKKMIKDFFCYIEIFIIFFPGYKDFQSRTDTRDNAWRSPGWDECVAYTVPLIREMQSRILHPTEFSPTK